MAPSSDLEGASPSVRLAPLKRWAYRLAWARVLCPGAAQAHGGNATIRKDFAYVKQLRVAANHRERHGAAPRLGLWHPARSSERRQPVQDEPQSNARQLAVSTTPPASSSDCEFYLKGGGCSSAGTYSEYIYMIDNKPTLVHNNRYSSVTISHVNCKITLYDGSGYTGTSASFTATSNDQCFAFSGGPIDNIASSAKTDWLGSGSSMTTVTTTTVAGGVSFGVRLADPMDPGSGLGYEGVLLVENSETGESGPVCNPGFTGAAAQVVCRQLGYEGGELVMHGLSSSESSMIESNLGSYRLTNVMCSGTEQRLDDCSSSGWGIQACSGGTFVTMLCSDSIDPGSLVGADIRLITSSDLYVGRLEVYYNGEWGTVCDDDFGDTEAEVACRALGTAGGHFILIGNVRPTGLSGAPNTIWLDDLNCHGWEGSLDECSHGGWGQHNCAHDEDVFISCDAAVSVPPTPAPGPVPSYWAVDGCADGQDGGDLQPELRAETGSAYVQCCSDSTAMAGCSRPNCVTRPTYAEAEADCAAQGLSLCTLEQLVLQSGERCCNVGGDATCGFLDDALTWTRTEGSAEDDIDFPIHIFNVAYESLIQNVLIRRDFKDAIQTSVAEELDVPTTNVIVTLSEGSVVASINVLTPEGDSSSSLRTRTTNRVNNGGMASSVLTNVGAVAGITAVTTGQIEVEALPPGLNRETAAATDDEEVFADIPIVAVVASIAVPGCCAVLLCYFCYTRNQQTSLPREKYSRKTPAPMLPKPAQLGALEQHAITANAAAVWSAHARVSCQATPLGQAEEVTFTDTDGDTIVFRRTANGKLDYYVNGVRKVTNLSHLSYSDGKLHLDGTSAGTWGSSRVTSPKNLQFAQRVMALYRGDASEAEMRKCSACWTPLRPGAAFCTVCGASTGLAPSPTMKSASPTVVGNGMTSPLSSPTSATLARTETIDYDDEPFVQVEDEDVLKALAVLLVPPASTKKTLGYGADVKKHAKGGKARKYDSLELETAWEIKASEQRSFYRTKKKQVSKQMKMIDEKNPDVKRTAVVPTGLDENALHSSLELDDSVNEKLLLHGTDAEKVMKIIRSGFDEKFANCGAFGNGTYLAEDPSKIDQYCAVDSPDTEDADAQELHEKLYGNKEHPGEVCYVILCQVILGCPMYTKHAVTDRHTHEERMPKSAHGACAPTESCLPDQDVFASDRYVQLTNAPNVSFPHHSLVVLAKQCPDYDLKRHREFVIFDGKAILPRYLVSYKRACTSTDTKSSS